MTIRPKIAEHIVDVISELQQAGYEAYIVGGAVRDFLLERQPKDYDLSTSATPEQIRKVFRDRRAIIIGRRFRLVHLYHGRDIIEISTFRRPPDPTQQHSVRPVRAASAPENMIFHDNEFGTAQEDAQRRDFTVNSIFYDPVHDRLIDFTENGIKDIMSGTVRIIGNPVLRFEEDPVRILRALKLVGQYGFSLEKNTEKALRQCMELVVHASPSRMTLELDKILKNPYGDKILRVFREYGFLKYFLPYFDEHFDSEQMSYAMALLAKRNERMLAGYYRDSLSLANAIFALPFAELEFDGNKPGELWTYRQGIDAMLKTIVMKIFSPHQLTKRGSAATVRTLLLQPRLRSANPRRFVATHGYPGGRELALIQNEVIWKDKDFEEKCPPPSHEKSKRKHRKKKHRQHRRETPDLPSAISS